RADVIALTVERRRVVHLEEEREDVAVGRPARVEDDLDGLGMTRMVAVRGVVVRTAGISDARVDHALLLADQVFETPETPAGQHGRLRAGESRDLSAVIDSARHDSFSFAYSS